MEDEVALCVVPRRAAADERALVLAAEGLSVRVVGTPEGFGVCVPPGEAAQARAALAAWERENAGPERTDAPEPPLDATPVSHALAVAFALVVFFLVTGPSRAASPWFVRGSADARRVLAGEPWRAVTALTLHADFPHVLGNALVGALFLAGVFRVFGLGAGAALVLVAGAGGNLLEAWLRGPEAVTVIGASTAVFAALGLLAGRGLVRGRARGLRGRSAFLPVAAALGLLAMLGTAGQHTDVWAHACGLAVGVALGTGATATRRLLASRALQGAAGTAALALLVGAWWLALRG
jgi:rhomboid protease GluP